MEHKLLMGDGVEPCEKGKEKAPSKSIRCDYKWAVMIETETLPVSL